MDSMDIICWTWRHTCIRAPLKVGTADNLSEMSRKC